jgi:cell division protein FtsN
MGPYTTREDAIRARGVLEKNGVSAIVIAADTN